PDPVVRFQTALALGNSRDSRAAAGLSQIARTDAANRWIRTAVLSSCPERADDLLREFWNDAEPLDASVAPFRAEFLGQLAQMVGARNRPAELSRVLDQLANGGTDASRVALRERLIVELGRGRRRSGGGLLAAQIPSAPGARLLGDVTRRFKAAALD